MSFRTIEIHKEKGVDTLSLNRPEKHNALNLELMQEVILYFQTVENDKSVRIVVIRGKGKSFCAGADLNWMKDSALLSKEENLHESELLSSFFATVYYSSKVTIAVTHGNVYGGGNGLVAACDFAYGLADSNFCLSETRLGLIAATITPYMMRKMNISVYKELIYTARIFNGKDSENFGLLNKTFSLSNELESYLKNTVDQILKAGPNSLIGSKKLVNQLEEDANGVILTNIPKILADTRITPEAKEGFNAFLEKRKPNWIE